MPNSMEIRGASGGYVADVSAAGALLMQSAGMSYRNISTATTTVVKSGPGTLDKIVFNKLTALGVITIYDNTAGSGTKIGTITQPASLLASFGALPFGCAFTTGLTIVTSAADDITVIYT